MKHIPTHKSLYCYTYYVIYIILLQVFLLFYRHIFRIMVYLQSQFGYLGWKLLYVYYIIFLFTYYNNNLITYWFFLLYCVLYLYKLCFHKVNVYRLQIIYSKNENYISLSWNVVSVTYTLVNYVHLANAL